MKLAIALLVLDAGADDYVVKPFSIEVLARVRSPATESERKMPMFNLKT